MQSDYTHISVILDRSGSMESIRDDIIGSFNAFVQEQKTEEGSATLTLVQFDTQNPYETVYDFTPIQFISALDRETYVPRASTPLLDALGRGINALERAILNMKEAERPSRVVMVVITDGQENSSREFRKDQIVKMIKEKTVKNDWQFVFLSADLGAIGDALSYGIDPDAALLFEKSHKGTTEVWASLSKEIGAYRTVKKKGLRVKAYLS
jgi:hypothetical protein